jgi:hypothetical protein
LQHMRNYICAAGVLAAAFAAQAQSGIGDWPSFGRDGSNQRFAPFAVIDRSNVVGLAPAWSYPLGTVGSAQTHPIVIGGVMYVGMAGNDVAALDGATGREIWRYRHIAKRALPQIPSNRGVAVTGGRVFEATDDACVIALDQTTGKVIWDEAVAPFDPSILLPSGAKNPDVEFQFRAAPLVLDGRVIVGATGFEANRFDDDFVKGSLAAGVDVGKAWIDANLGRRAFLAALDAETGAEVWRWYTTKEDGWEGSFAPASPDGTPLNRDIAAEKAAAPLYKNAWAAGSTTGPPVSSSSAPAIRRRATSISSGRATTFMPTASPRSTPAAERCAGSSRNRRTASMTRPDRRCCSTRRSMAAPSLRCSNAASPGGASPSIARAASCCSAPMRSSLTSTHTPCLPLRAAGCRRPAVAR